MRRSNMTVRARQRERKLQKPLSPLAPKVSPNSPLQFTSSLAEQVGQVLQVVAGRDTELAHKVLGGRFQVAVLLARVLLLGASEVGVGGDS